MFRLIQEFVSRHRNIIGLLICLLTVTCFATFKLTESPKTWFDEGIFLQIARNQVVNHSFTIRVSPTQLVSASTIATVGFPVIAPISVSFRLFGVGLLQARVVMVLYVIFTVGIAFLFSLRQFGLRVALLSTLLIATHAPFYGNGKNVLGEVPGLFFFFVFLYCVAQLEQRKGKGILSWFAVGYSAGIFMATKPNFLLLIPVSIIAGLICRKRFTWDWRGGVALIVGAAFPVWINAMIQFGSLSSFLHSFGTYSNVLGIQALTGLTLPQLIVKNLLLFVQQSTPAYLLVSVLVWMVFVCVRWSQKQQIPLHEYLALGFTAATMAYFLKMPGFFRYLFVAQIISFPYFVYSAFQLLHNVRNRFRPNFRIVLTGLFSMLMLFQAYQVMFSSFVAGYYGSARASQLATFVQTLAPSTHVFLFHVPEVATFLPTENYSQYIMLLYFNDAIGGDQLESLQRGESDVVIVSDEMIAEAEPYLSAYHLQQKLDEGRYLIYARTH